MKNPFKPKPVLDTPRPYVTEVLTPQRVRERSTVDTAPALRALLVYSMTSDAEKAMATFRNTGGVQ